MPGWKRAIELIAPWADVSDDELRRIQREGGREFIDRNGTRWTPLAIIGARQDIKRRQAAEQKNQEK
jgi:hypothetical protein